MWAPLGVGVWIAEHCMFGVQFLGVSGSAGPWSPHRLCPPILAGGIPSVRPGGSPWRPAVALHCSGSVRPGGSRCPLAPSEAGLRQSFGL